MTTAEFDRTTERRRLIASPVVTVVALVVVAGLCSVAWFAARDRLADAGRAETADLLRSQLASTEATLVAWQDHQTASARAWASNERVRSSTRSLLAQPAEPADLVAATAQRELRDYLAPVLEAHGYRGFFVIAPDGTSLASTRDTNVGTRNLLVQDQPDVFADLVRGESVVSQPQFTDVPIQSADGSLVADLPTMFVGAPILDDDDEVIAVLTFRLDPTTTFENVFTSQRWGATGEVFAVSEEGTLLVASRFRELLVDAGLVADGSGVFSVVELVDPGVDLTDDGTDSAPSWTASRATVAAISLREGESGYDVSGYDSYLGRPVVGAWTWNRDLGVGIAAEITEAEATAVTADAVQILDWFTAGILIALVTAAGLVALRAARPPEMAAPTREPEAAKQPEPVAG